MNDRPDKRAPAPDPNVEYLKTEQVLELVGIGRRMLELDREEKKIAFWKPGRRPLFHPLEVKRYTRERDAKDATGRPLLSPVYRQFPGTKLGECAWVPDIPVPETSSARSPAAQSGDEIDETERGSARLLYGKSVPAHLAHLSIADWHEMQRFNREFFELNGIHHHEWIRRYGDELAPLWVRPPKIVQKPDPDEDEGSG